MSDWQKILRTNFTSWKELADFLEFNEEQREKILKSPPFRLNLPRRLAEKIVKGKWDDPLLKQFLPTMEEEVRLSRFGVDPVGDRKAQLTPHLLHKYNVRALLVTTSACAMHCRYCFRQNYPFETPDKNFERELVVLKEDTSIEELILSGGDPLSLSNRMLSNLFDQLKLLPHIKRIRFHTRFPIGIPERIDEEFLAILNRAEQQIWFVVHINHPREMDDDIWKALTSIQKLGIPILSQSVLLKGVNDQEEVLKSLCEQLINHGVMPYYLHQLDPVQGAHHFEVDESKGLTLIKYLESHLPGFAVPKYVREVAGKESKIQIT